MKRIIRFTLVSTVVVALSACSRFSSAIGLTAQVQNANDPFNSIGQLISYHYVVTNIGNSRLAGPVIVTDLQREVTCPAVNTVGNLDTYLDPNETITCAGSYAITQMDLNTGSVTNNATANVGGIKSDPASVTVTLNAAPGSPLTLTKTASPTTYSQIGQTIAYTFVITNTGTATLGPSRFTVNDDRLGEPFNCGPEAITLATNQTATCTAAYVITQADMSAPTLTNSATASGGGVPASQPATATITNLTGP
jgi:uncharacterized repeat protein (TIGR01451 family)